MNTATKPPQIAITPCESSRIHGYGWDAATNTLALQFKKKGEDGKPAPGSIYHYSGVDAETFKALREAESVGKFFGSVINAKDEHGKLYYPFVKVEPEAEA